jgi:hypothetical protein
VYGIFLPTMLRSRTYLVLFLVLATGWFFEMFYYHMRNLDKLINAGSPPKQKDEVKKEVKTLSEAD